VEAPTSVDVTPDTDPSRVRAALADVDSLGGFFAVSTRDAESADPSWRPVSELYGPPTGGDALDRRIEEVAGQLGATRRVAASLLGLSLSARGTAVLLAAVVEHGILPLLPADRLRWRPWPGGPIPWWIGEPGGHAVGAPDTAATADAVAVELDRAHLRPLVEAIRARESVSPQVLWGNAASSLAGAVRVLAVERPHARDGARALATALLERAPLAGLGAFTPEPAHPTGFGFVRSTCCLFHRVPGGGTCGDCVIRG
jgi:hypothetical protein